MISPSSRGLCIRVLLCAFCAGGCTHEPVAEAESLADRPAAGAASAPAGETSDCVTDCSVEPGGSCLCTQSCDADHSRAMSCDPGTCVCMLDDREVFAFATDRACASAQAARAAFNERCGALLDEGTLAER